MWFSRRIPFWGDIKIAVTAPILLNIGSPVKTGANNVFILFPISGGQTAGTAHIAVAFFIDQKGLQQFKHPFPVLIKEISLRFLSLLQYFI
jgi:hypothetical protein